MQTKLPHNVQSFLEKQEPDWREKTIRIITSGDHSLAVILNERVVYRFPLKPDYNAEYEFEAALLNRIRSIVPLPVPAVEILKQGDIAVARHQMIPGVSYSQERVSLTAAQKNTIADQLAEFLAALHAVHPKGLAADKAMETALTDDEINILPPSDREAARHVTRAYEAYQKRCANRSAVLCHNDFNENNILIKDGRVSGIIDFGNAVVQDYVVDFAALLKYDFDLVHSMARSYEKRTGQTVRLADAAVIQKLRCYKGLTEQASDLRVARYRRWLTYLTQHEERSL